jgi:hypothetical protein
LAPDAYQGARLKNLKKSFEFFSDFADECDFTPF